MSHFSSGQFVSQQFASQHFAGAQAVIEAPKGGSGSSHYDEYLRRQYDELRIREDDEEIIEIVTILLKQGIL